MLVGLGSRTNTCMRVRVVHHGPDIISPNVRIGRTMERGVDMIAFDSFLHLQAVFFFVFQICMRVSLFTIGTLRPLLAT